MSSMSLDGGLLWLLFVSLRFVLIPFWIFIFLKDHFFLVAIHWALNLGYQHRGSTFRCIYVTNYWKCKVSTLIKSCSEGVDFGICWCLAFLVFLTPPPPIRPPKLTLHYWLSVFQWIKRWIPTFPWLILNSLPWSVVQQLHFSCSAWFINCLPYLLWEIDAICIICLVTSWDVDFNDETFFIILIFLCFTFDSFLI